MRALLSLALRPKRLLGVLGALVGTALYVWIAAVRAVPAVQARKTAFRIAWRNRDRTRTRP